MDLFNCCTTREPSYARKEHSRAPAYDQTGVVRPLQSGHASQSPPGGGVIKISRMPNKDASAGPEPTAAPSGSRHSEGRLPGSPTKCGVGIVFRPLFEPEICLSVWTVAPDSPAGQLGGFVKGDVLTHVGDTDVRGMPPQDVAPLIVGKEGTLVRLKFSRNGGEQVEVSLPRKWG